MGISGKAKLMPAFFIGQGNPMNALLENSFTKEWREIGKNLNPRAVACVSAHWETPGTFVASAESLRTIHDFYGFPPELFNVRYPAPGAPDIALELAAEPGIGIDGDWGLDHGAWSVLAHIFPDADIPVFQISLDRLKSPSGHYEFSKKLACLRRKGVMVIGSGNIVHNLRRIDFSKPEGDGRAIRANESLKAMILSRDIESLLNYQMMGEDIRSAIPTPEHFLPLIYFLGVLEKDESAVVFNDALELGSISMASFKTID